MNLAEIEKLFLQNKHTKVLQKGEKYLKQKGRDKTLLTVLSASCGVLKKYALSVKYGLLSLELDSRDSNTHNNLGMSYMNLYDFSRAKKHFLEAIALKHTNTNPSLMLAKIYLYEKELKESKFYFDKAKEMESKNKFIDFHTSIYYLITNNYEVGFDMYRARYSKENSSKDVNLVIESNLLDKTTAMENMDIYIDHEQGFGDIIQFIRYIPLLQAKKVKSITLRVPKELKRLLYFNYGGICKFIEVGEKLAFNYHFPIMDFAYIFNTNSKSVPFKESYLRVQESDAKIFYEKYFIKEHKKSIGIVFRGNPMHNNDKHRSIEVEEFFKGLGELSQQYSMYSLQYEPTKKEKKFLKESSIIDLSSYCEDFYHTALALNSLDLLISVDTSVVHLAGAMNKKTFLLLPFISDWRWGLEGDENNWYRSVCICRALELGGWSDAFKRMRDKVLSL